MNFIFFVLSFFIFVHHCYELTRLRSGFDNDCVVVSSSLALSSSVPLLLKNSQETDQSIEKLRDNAFSLCDVASVQALIDRYPQGINDLKNGNGLLHIAIERESSDTVEFLIKNQHVNLNVRNGERQSPLLLLYEKQFYQVSHNNILKNLWALISSRGRKNLERLDRYVDMLIKTDPVYLSVDDICAKLKSLESLRGFNGFLQNHLLKNRIKKLVLHRIQMEYLDELSKDIQMFWGESTKTLWREDKNSVFNEAIKRKNLKMVQKLIHTYDVDIQRIDKQGRTPLHRASSQGSFEIMKYLVGEGADILAQDKNKISILRSTIDSGNAKMVHYILALGKERMLKEMLDKENVDLAVKQGLIKIVLKDKNKDSHATHYLFEDIIFEEDPQKQKSFKEEAKWKEAEAKWKEKEKEEWKEERGKRKEAKRKEKEKEEEEEKKRKEEEKKRKEEEAKRNILEKEERRQRAIEAMGQKEISFYEAIAGGLFEIVEYWVDEGVLITQKNATGETPLNKAIQGGHLDIVKYLVNEGVLITQKNATGETSLDKAIQGGHLDIVKYLVNEGVLITQKNAMGETALDKAIQGEHLDIVKYLVQNGADVRNEDREETTTLDKAIEIGNLEIVKYLFENDAEWMDIYLNHRRASLYKAIEIGDLDIVKYLVQHGLSMLSWDSKDRSPLDCPIEKENVEIVKYLVADGVGGTLALEKAIEEENLELVKYLFENDAEGRVEKREKITSYLKKAIKIGNLDIVKYFFKNREKTDLDFNPLNFAVENGHLGLIQFFLEKGAIVSNNPIDMNDRTILHQAVVGDNVGIVDLLIKHGADMEAKDIDGNTVLFQAVHRNSSAVVQYLLQQNMDINSRNYNGDSLLCVALMYRNMEMVELLREKGATLNDEDVALFFPHVVQGENLKLVKFLREQGADVNARSTDGKSMLELAIENSNSEIVNDLLEHNANIHEISMYGKSMLGLAIKKSNLEMAKCLVEHDANVDMISKNGDVLLRKAVNMRRLDLLKWLVEGAPHVSVQEHYRQLNFNDTNVEIVQYFLDQGLDIRKIFSDDQIPRTYLSQKNFKMIQLFLREGRYANRFVEGRLDDVKWFIEQYLEKSDREEIINKLFPLAIQTASFDVIKYLIEQGADIHNVDSEKTPLEILIKRSALKCIPLFIEGKANKELLLKESQQLFHIAIMKNDLEMVQLLVQQGIDIKKIMRQNPKFIFDVILKTNKDMIKYLFKNGMAIDEEEIVQIVLSRMYPDNNTFQVIQWLIENKISQPGKDFLPKLESFFRSAVDHRNLDEIKFFMEQIMKINDDIKNLAKIIPWSFAIKRGNLEIIKYLVKQGADVKEIETYPKSLSIAMESGHLRMIRFFVEEGLDVNVFNNKRGSVLSLAIERGTIEDIKFFVEHNADLQHVNENQETVLPLAIERGDLQIVKYLVEQGCDVNKIDKHGNSALFKAVRKSDFRMVQFLVAHDANVDHVNDKKVTVLSLAIESGDLQIVKDLLEAGRDVNKIYRNGNSALFKAVRKSDFRMVQFLVEHDANVDHVNNNNKKALHLAIEQGSLQIVKYLVKKGVDIKQEESDGRFVLSNARDRSVIEYLIEEGADINQKNIDGKTLLEEAIEITSLRDMQYYMERGADINSIGKDQKTLFHKIIEINRLDMIHICLKYAKIPLNLKGYRDQDGDSYIHWAYKKESYDVLKFLCEEKEEVSKIKNKDGKTVLELATADNNKTCLTMFNNIRTSQAIEEAA